MLLRGINLGASNRVAMPALREALARAGFERVRTHLQSGNILLDSQLPDAELAQVVAELLSSEFGLSVPVVVRGRGDLAEVVAENPFPDAPRIAPKRLQVTFLSAALGEEVAAWVRSLSAAEFAEDVETVALARSLRNVYGWHPDGIHGSRLARELTDRRLGVIATARNWSTVTTLLEMASDAG